MIKNEPKIGEEGTYTTTRNLNLYIDGKKLLSCSKK